MTRSLMIKAQPKKARRATDLGMGQVKSPGYGSQVLICVSIVLFWVPSLDPHRLSLEQHVRMQTPCENFLKGLATRSPRGVISLLFSPQHSDKSGASEKLTHIAVVYFWFGEDVGAT